MEARIRGLGLACVLALAVASVGACGAAPARAVEAAACAPLTLTLDGEAQRWTHVLAYKARGNTVVRIYNHEGVTCEHLVENRPVSVPRDEQLINIAVMGGQTYVTYAPDPSGGTATKSKLVRGGEKAGDTLGLCLPEALTLAGKGVHEGHTVVISGLVEAKYCGAQK
jgi:hypothetical protein